MTTRARAGADVYPFSRRGGDEDEEDEGPRRPADDATDFRVSELQRISREQRDTYRKMEKLWNEIQERLRNPWRQA
jgi:hypothetical protein